MSTPRRPPGPLLRPRSNARTWAAPLLVLLALTGALTAVADAVAIRQLREINPRMAGVVTVVVWEHGLESADAAQARAAEILSGAGQVTQLDPAEGDELIARAMGVPSPNAAEARLLTVTGAAAPHVAQTLRVSGLEARIDDRTWPDSPTLRAQTVVVAAGVALPLIIVLAVAGVCAWGARREAVSASAAVDLMRQFGATDGLIAAQFRRRWAGLALICAMPGAGAAIVLAYAWTRQSNLAAVQAVGRLDLVWAAPWILACGVIGFLASGGAGQMKSAP